MSHLAKIEKREPGLITCSIRFAPPLVISEEDIRKAVKIIGESLEELDVVSHGSHIGQSRLADMAAREDPW